jgi:hypothetical protein
MAERAVQDRRAAPRKQKTLFCQLKCGGKRVPAVVLDVSPSGLFVRTAIPATRGTQVEVTLRLAGGKSWSLRAEVVRDAQAGRRRDLLHGLGMGLRITTVPDGFAEFVEGLKADGWHSR